MKIKDQVCSLEQAKRLKELGIVYEGSPFAWLVIMPDIKGETYFHEVVYKHEIVTTLCELIAPAFTTAELGVMLGAGKNCVFTGEYWTAEGIWGIGIIGKTEADCRALLLIHLLENCTEMISEVNKRLSA